MSSIEESHIGSLEKKRKGGRKEGRKVGRKELGLESRLQRRKGKQPYKV